MLKRAEERGRCRRPQPSATLNLSAALLGRHGAALLGRHSHRGFDYLLGLVVMAGGVEQRHSFWADGPGEEPRIFQQFLDIMGQHPDAWLYTYGSYEATFLRRMAK